MSNSPKIIRLLVALIVFCIAALCLLATSFLPELDSSKTTDLSILFEQAERITNLVRPPETPADRPIVISGEFRFRRPAFDYKGITQGPFLALHRIVQTYAWVEEAVPENELPPNPKLTDRYRYHAEWLDNPTPWRQLKVWKDHNYNNPAVTDEFLFADGIVMGRLLINLQEATLPDWEPIKLDPTQYESLKFETHDDRYIYPTPAVKEKPQPGDYRVAYDGVKLKEGSPQIMTVLGARDFNTIVPFQMADGRRLLLVVLGDESAMKAVVGTPPVSLALVKWLQVALPIAAGFLLLVAIALAVFALKRRPIA